MINATASNVEVGAAEDAERVVRNASSGNAPGHADAIPPEVAQRYVREGRQLHFPDRTLAIDDRSDRLIATTDNGQVAADLVHIAKARGWTVLDVRGSELFKALILREAREQGIAVKGVETGEARSTSTEQIPTNPYPQNANAPAGLPTQAQHAGKAFANSQTRRAFRPPAPPPLQPGETAIGKLIDHGDAPYRRDPQATRSYFVRIRTDTGERECWGTDLKRAIRQSRSHPQLGDEIGVQYRGRRESYPDPDHEQRSTPSRRQLNLWHVERREFFDTRKEQANALRAADSAAIATAAYRSPHDRALVQVATLDQLAKVFAAERIAEEADRRRFTDAVRRTLAESLEQGQPLPEVRLRHTPRTQKTRPATRDRSEATQGRTAPDDPALTR